MANKSNNVPLGLLWDSKTWDFITFTDDFQGSLTVLCLTSSSL